jgi:hypothetical protein
MGVDDGWYSLQYTLDNRCWGYLVEHRDEGVYAYEKGVRRVVPSFHRFEHAALFARHLAARPALARGGSHDLAPLYAYATGALEAPPDALEDTWWFLLDVAHAAGLDDLLPRPSDGEEPRRALRECFDAFRRALEHLDD